VALGTPLVCRRHSRSIGGGIGGGIGRRIGRNVNVDDINVDSVVDDHDLMGIISFEFKFGVHNITEAVLAIR
jgi:hypothetical protein